MIWPLAPISALPDHAGVDPRPRRDELHDDPVVLIIRDWRSQLVILTGAAMLLAGDWVSW